ncbi:MAG: cyclic pyranopterin monophosphate synthase MoaC [Syntrophomonadaceae bacterium]|nr:cyclic pyranopterin monophosphate synthase MoaC [Syntrophomonadaceae bacterium]
MKLTHLDELGRAKMVDVSDKPNTRREARARVEVHMLPQTAALIREGGVVKGDVLAAARIAGIMGAKRTGSLIPLCHPLSLSQVEILFRFQENRSILEIEAQTKTVGPTGVEMEALTAAALAALTVYDMCKAVDRSMIISNLRLVEKSGGKSGLFCREGESTWDG